VSLIINNEDLQQSIDEIEAGAKLNELVVKLGMHKVMFMFDNRFEYNWSEQIFINESTKCFVDIEHMARASISEIQALLIRDTIAYNRNPKNEVKYLPPFMQINKAYWDNIIRSNLPI
jgi:hypothetical protein